MINKKLIVLTAIVATTGAWSMENDRNAVYISGTPIDIKGDASIHRTLVASVPAIRARVADEHNEAAIPMDEWLMGTILIVGSDVTTPLSELGALNPEELQEAVQEFITHASKNHKTTRPGLANIQPAEYDALKGAVNECVWPDAACRGLTTVTLGAYLAQADQETKRRCIAHMQKYIVEQESLMIFHAAMRIKQHEKTSASFNGNLATALFEMLALNEKTERQLLAKFGLEVPAAPIDYAALIAKTKQTLAELSQQQ